VNGLAGWHAGANQNLLIEDNLVEDIGGLPVQGHVEHGAIKILRVTSSLVRRNVIRHCVNDIVGIWLDGECANNRVTQNLVHDINGMGIFFEINCGPNMADNNIFLNTASHGFYSHDSSRHIVMQNLIANVKKGSAVHIRYAAVSRFGYLRLPWEDESWVRGNILVNAERYVNLPNLTSGSDFNLLGGRMAGSGKPFALFSEYKPEKNGDYDRAEWKALGLDASSIETTLSVSFDEKSMELRVIAPPGFEMKPFPGIPYPFERFPSMGFVAEMFQADFLGRPRTEPRPKDDEKEIVGLPMPRDRFDIGPLLNLPLDGTPIKVDPRRQSKP
jgi:hypothetical protein